jgi:hypothetical protein
MGRPQLQFPPLLVELVDRPRFRAGELDVALTRERHVIFLTWHVQLPSTVAWKSAASVTFFGDETEACHHETCQTPEQLTPNAALRAEVLTSLC